MQVPWLTHGALEQGSGCSGGNVDDVGETDCIELFEE